MALMHGHADRKTDRMDTRTIMDIQTDKYTVRQTERQTDAQIFGGQIDGVMHMNRKTDRLKFLSLHPICFCSGSNSCISPAA